MSSGKEKLVSVGPYPAISLQGARLTYAKNAVRFMVASFN